MALIWTKLAEEAEPIQRTKRGVANDDTAGQTQVPRGSASDAMPTLRKCASACLSLAASSLTWTTAVTNVEQRSCEPCHESARFAYEMQRLENRYAIATNSASFLRA